MLADTTERPGLDEMYQTAAATSNMHVGNDSTLRTPGDLIAASGMNRHRMGLALLRLRSEWAGSARPAAPTEAQIQALATSYPIEPPLDRYWHPPLDCQLHVNPNAGKVMITKDGKTHYRLPARQARQEAAEWYEQELLLLLMHLKSLPWVRAGLLARAQMGGWAPDEHRVADVLLWWLDPKCKECGGAKERVIPDSGGRTNGRPCRHCRGTGQQDPPQGRAGERIAGYIRGCIGAAKRELSEGVYCERRTHKGEVARQAGQQQEDAIEVNAWAYQMQQRVHAAAERELDWKAAPATALRRCAKALVDRDVEWAVTEAKGEPPVFWVVEPTK